MTETAGWDKRGLVALGRDNYGRWRHELETALRGKSLWWYVDGTVPKVEVPAAGASADDVKAYQEWDAKDAKARAMILRTLDDMTYSHVADCVSSKAILDRIAELRDPKTTDVLMDGMTSFFAETWLSTDDVSAFMARLAIHAARVNACKDAKVKIEDKFVMAKTLTSLPSSFGNFVSSWRMMAKSDSTLTDFREKLLSSERAMTGSSHPDVIVVGGEALAAKAKPGRKGKPKPDKSKTTCHKCGKAGHWKRECPDLQKTEQSAKGDGNAYTAFGNIALMAHGSSSAKTIIADSGASRHMTGVRSWFKSLRRLEQPLRFTAADGHIVATHEGDIEIETSIDGKRWTRGTWCNVLYVPVLQISLFSTTTREDDGFGFTHSRRVMTITKDGKPMIGGRREGTSYRPYIRVIESEGSCMAVQTMDVWHQRLGHVSDDVVKAMDRNGCVDGLHVSGDKRKPCDACHFGKQTASHHPSCPVRECLPGERLHSDVCHATVTSLGGATKFVTLKDEASGFRMVRFIRSTKDVRESLTSMIAEAERINGRKVVSVRTDNGTEYTNAQVRELLSQVDHELSAPYVKQGNGIAERENRILCDTARSMLFHAELTRDERRLLWAEAVNTAAYIRNRLPNNRTGKSVTPYELWYGHKPDVSFMRVFGATAFVHVPDEKRNKFDAKSRKTVFVGYDHLTDKVYRVFDREKRVIDRVSNVKFVESDMIDDVFESISKRLVLTDTSESEEEDGDEPEQVQPQAGGSNGDEANDEAHSEEGAEDPVTDPESEVPVVPQPVAPQKRGRGRPLGSKNKPKPPPIPHAMNRRPDPKARKQFAMAVALDPETINDLAARDDQDEW